MLEYVDPHPRDLWLQAGMALQAEFGDAAFDAWDRWSAAADNYDARAVASSWRGFRRRAGIGIGTLVKLARDAGYRFERLPADAPPDPGQLERARAERAQRNARLAHQRAEAARQAAASARERWRGAERTGRSAYAQRKLIESPEGVRYAADGSLLVPMLRYDLPPEQRLRGHQSIAADGTKRYAFGMDKEGCACRLGLAEVGEPVLLCEGWATGMTLRMATERRAVVYVAFDAGNLSHVAEIVHAAHPGCPLVLCADDDWRTLDAAGRPLSPGRVQAAAARDAVQAAGGRALLAVPIFRPGRKPGWTDFNDLHQAEGLDAVREQLALALEVARGMKRHG